MGKHSAVVEPPLFDPGAHLTVEGLAFALFSLHAPLFASHGAVWRGMDANEQDAWRAKARFCMLQAPHVPEGGPQ